MRISFFVGWNMHFLSVTNNYSNCFVIVFMPDDIYFTDGSHTFSCCFRYYTFILNLMLTTFAVILNDCCLVLYD